MPSTARVAFEQTSTEVRDFFAIHQLALELPGLRKKLRTLNKGTIVVVTAIWEAFCEDLASEALELLVREASSDQLPKVLRKSVARELRADKNELAVWGLAGDEWRELLLARLEGLQAKRDRHLNTPKTAQIDGLFEEALGITVSQDWVDTGKPAREAQQTLDRFVELRGKIAHRGLKGVEVEKATVRRYINHVNFLVSRTESTVEAEIGHAIGHLPWTVNPS